MQFVFFVADYECLFGDAVWQKNDDVGVDEKNKKTMILTTFSITIIIMKNIYTKKNWIHKKMKNIKKKSKPDKY